MLRWLSPSDFQNRAMLAPPRTTEAFRVARARWTCRAGACTCVWPGSFPMIARRLPGASGLEAKL